MALQLRFPVLIKRTVINGIPDRKDNLSRVQFFLGNSPLALPGLAGAHGKRRRAELINLLAAGIIQRYRSRQVAFPDIGHGNGYINCFRTGKLGFAEIHGGFYRTVRRKRRGYAYQDQRNPQYQCKEQVFPVHIVSEREAPSSFPLPAGPADVSIWMDTGYLQYFIGKAQTCQEYKERTKNKPPALYSPQNRCIMNDTK